MRWPVYDKEGRHILRDSNNRRRIVKVTPQWLCRWYRRNGAVWTRAPYHIANAWSPEEMLEKQKQAVI